MMRQTPSRPRTRVRLLTALFTAGAVFSGGASADAAMLYNIVSFDATDDTVPVSTTVQYVADPVLITTYPGLTGTTASELLTLQTIRPDAGTVVGGTRFQNSDADAAQTAGTLIADASANYFQFGITGGSSDINLESLTFDAKKATAAAATRGYNVVVSVNGGAYQPLGAANVVADRATAPFDNITLPLSGAAFQGVSSVDFRINSTGGGVEYTNIAINGTVVPEPGTIGALGVAAIGLLAARRRRKA